MDSGWMVGWIDGWLEGLIDALSFTASSPTPYPYTALLLL